MKYFGTDGIRGTYEKHPITISFIPKIAWAFGQFLKHTHLNPSVLIGKDTRSSSQAISNAVIQGLQSANIHTIYGGVAPTPAIALTTKHFHAQGAIVITASHNPATDNGLKFFNYQGIKLSKDDEMAIEKLIDEAPNEYPQPQTSQKAPVCEQYIKILTDKIPKNSLNGFKVALDTANGSGSTTSKIVLEHAGVTVIPIGNTPNGININDQVGSEHPIYVAKTVIDHKAHLGLAQDGDADRLICIDENGCILPGEVFLGSIALFMQESGQLKNQTLVTTIQSNYGLDQFLKNHGIRTLRTDVGDRNILEELLNKSSNFGGEASGHFIFSDISPCGDGLIAALELLKYLKHKQLSAKELHQLVPLLPQVSINIAIQKKPPLSTLPHFYPTYQQITKQLQPSGRLLARYSGTENKLRILIEGPDEENLKGYLTHLLEAAEKDLN